MREMREEKYESEEEKTGKNNDDGLAATLLQPDTLITTATTKLHIF